MNVQHCYQKSICHIYSEKGLETSLTKTLKTVQLYFFERTCKNQFMDTDHYVFPLWYLIIMR